MRVVTCNVNGVRAAAGRGGLDQLRRLEADVVCLQEVRATREQFDKVLSDRGWGDWNVAFAESAAKGRNGVALLSRHDLSQVRGDLVGFGGQGRWVEAVVAAPEPVRVAAVYVFTGGTTPGNPDDPRDASKRALLGAMTDRMSDGDLDLVAGDLNVAHHERDLRNWRGRVGRSGFLPAERDFLDRWEETGWTDTARAVAGQVDGPYTWWSMRGRAFDNDTGWRIDYIWAAPGWKGAARAAWVDRAARWDQRWSDHAPQVVDFVAPPKA